MLDADFNLKISEFVLSCKSSGKNHTGFTKSRVGSDSFKAPEVLAGLNYQPMIVDLFSIGVILFCMYTGNKPFKQANYSDKFFAKIANYDHNQFWQLHEELMEGNNRISDSFKDLIINMLSFQPYGRLQMAEIFAHPFFSEDNGTSITHDEVRIEMSMRLRVMRVKGE